MSIDTEGEINHLVPMLKNLLFLVTDANNNKLERFLLAIL